MVYYIETNVISILVGVILLYQGRMISSKHETSQIIMNWMLCLLIAFSCSDIAAYCFRGKSYLGVELANTFYFMGMAMGAYIWFLYVLVKLGIASNMRRTILCTCGPIVILCVAIVLNPLTNFFFSVDENNLYHRGNGIFITWIVEWGYVISALVLNIRAVMREERSFRKSELRGYMVFAVPIAVAAICQMLFYGTTTTQIGFMFGMLLAYLNTQHYQVQRDELTGLNNRNALLRFQDSIATRSSALDLTMFVIDADRFKSINDVFGHLKGDQALKDIALALKAAVGHYAAKRVQLYRYGGDEFIIIGTDLDDDSVNSFKYQIHDELEQVNMKNRANGEKYRLSVSIGCARKSCSLQNDFSELMKQADEAMYLEKKSMKKIKQ